MPRATFVLGAAILSVLLAACGSDERAASTGVASEAPLPRPEPSGGAITEMPSAPGPGEVPLAGSAPPPPPDPMRVDGATGLPPLEDNPETGLAEMPALPPPTPEDARQVLRDYYAALNARDVAAAQAAWVDGNAAQAALAEAGGGASTVELLLGEPRAIEGTAGSVHVEVPVTVTSRRADGSSQLQAGRYTLRRSQVDGASAAERAWRIEAVDLRAAR